MIHADLVIRKDLEHLEKKVGSTSSVYKMCGSWHWYLGELGVHVVDSFHLGSMRTLPGESEFKLPCI